MAFPVLLPYIFFLLLCSHSKYITAHSSNNSTSSPLKFLNQLIHVQKGDNVQNLHHLKSYLSYLGYLKHDNYSNHQKLFDDGLESALKKYQKFYHLKATGILDADTIKTMCQPRCSMPDMIMISRYQFLRGKPKWQKMILKYAFDWNVREEVKSPLQNALKEWESVTSFKFSYVRNFSQADIKFSFMSGDHGDEYPFPYGGLAHSFPPPDGRVHFDVHRVWSWTGKRNAYDVQSVGLHELGHVLGLDHSTVFKAVMYPLIYPGEKKGLNADDVNGIRALYKIRVK